MNGNFPRNPQSTERNERSRSAKTWLTLGTVAAYAAVSITKCMPAWAQNAPATAKPKEQQSLTVRRLDIPVGPLDATIKTYEQLTGQPPARRGRVTPPPRFPSCPASAAEVMLRYTLHIPFPLANATLSPGEQCHAFVRFSPAFDPPIDLSRAFPEHL